ncbi:AAA family ATPase [Myxococcota bacterium]|nr:AAA family ATPase [Myxococcota bacterium]
MAEQQLPAWAEEIRATYLRGESSVFVVHGNVFDLILHKGELTPLVDFLVNVVLSKKDVIVHYNTALGVRFRKKDAKVENVDELFGVKEGDKALPALEKLLLTQDNVGVVIDYAETIAPGGDPSFQSEADRRAVVTLHRWSLDRRFENADNVVILVSELLTELSPKIVSNPKITAITVPLPEEGDRAQLIRLVEPEATQRDVDRLASLSAGLKAIQIRGILAPGEDSEEDQVERYEYILAQLGAADGAKERAKHITKVTTGYTRKQLDEYLVKQGISLRETGASSDSRYDEVFKLLARRKREILEKECFGLIEFVEPKHDFSAVGGMDEVKKDLMTIAKNIREANKSRVPMGLLFVGPMGTGKTFVCEAFAKSSGLTAIKMKNFRSKWVGATEGNLEKILSVVKAIGNILVIIDEGDRAFGNSDGDGDGGTSSRVIARLKEFMSDTTNRGRVLFVLMTNRPDKLDIDIKRAGRLDKKIPFFYPEEPDEVEPVLVAQLRRHKVNHALEFPRDRDAVSAKLVGYSNADVEAVVLLANEEAEASGVKASVEVFQRAITDYLPSRDARMLEYMELLAVFESSSRAMLPKRYAGIQIDELQDKLQTLKLQIR